MRLFAAPGIDEADARRWGSLPVRQAITCVLQYDTGRLDFFDQPLARDLLGSGAVLRCQNFPDWRRAADTTRMIPLAPGESKFVGVAAPSEDLWDHLRNIQADRVALKKAALKGVQPTGVPRSGPFSNWIAPDGTLNPECVADLLAESEWLSLWDSSEWGLHPILLSADLARVRRLIVDSANARKVQLSWLASVAEFPSW